MQNLPKIRVRDLSHPIPDGLEVDPPELLERKVINAVVEHELIAQRAHEIWLAAGCPEGRALEHWLQAEEEARR